MNDVPNPAELLGRVTALQSHIGEEKKTSSRTARCGSPGEC